MAGSRLYLDRPYVFPGVEIASAPWSTDYVITNAFATISGWSAVAPAGSPAYSVVLGPLLLNCVTGTNAAGTGFTVEAKAIDEASATVAYVQWKFFSSSASSQTWVDTRVSWSKRLTSPATDKTYTVQAKCSLVGTNSCTAKLFTSQSGFPDPELAILRRA
jgi:hypothetical protein